MAERLLIGAIADDYTGATDLASMVRDQGLRTGVVMGLQAPELLAEFQHGYDALIIALKSRSNPAAEARAMSARALDQLLQLRARQIYFKYCSTFDSTAEGNIGPVADALMDTLGTDFTVAVPALPVNGRTQYLGHLFVDEHLLSESHMRQHPVTPMTDASLVRHLGRQTRRRVGLVPHRAVRAGPHTIRECIQQLRAGRVSIALVDATSDADLLAIAESVANLPLVTGGSGLGMALAQVWARRGLVRGGPLAASPINSRGGVLVVAGSCSAVTLEQLRVLEAVGGAGIRIDALRLLEGDEGDELERLERQTMKDVRERGWALAYASADAADRNQVIERARALGVSPSAVARRLECAIAELARRAVVSGIVSNLVVAGGETSGAVTEALQLRALEIGETLDPGVPIARSIGGAPVNVVFKSGNFGSPELLVKALRRFGEAVA